MSEKYNSYADFSTHEDFSLVELIESVLNLTIDSVANDGIVIDSKIFNGLRIAYWLSHELLNRYMARDEMEMEEMEMDEDEQN